MSNSLINVGVVLLVALMVLSIALPATAQDTVDDPTDPNYFLSEWKDKQGPIEYNQYCWLFFVVLGSFSCYLVFKGIRRM